MKRRIHRTTLCIVAGLALLLAARILVGRPGGPRVQLQRRHEMMTTAVTAIGRFKGYHGVYPPATARDCLGRPTCSWRLALRCFVEQATRPLDKPGLHWCHPTNLRWVTDPYASHWTLASDTTPASRLVTHVVAITGPGTVLGVAEGCSQRVPDDVILLVEMANSSIIWAEPTDLDVRSSPLSLTSGPDGKGLFVAFADNEIWYLRSSVPLERLRHFFTIQGARSHDRDQELLRYRVMVP